MGPTERAPFAITVACPLDVAPVGTALPEAEPFARRVTTLLLRALQRLTEAVATDRCDTLLQGQEPTLFSSLCEALLSLRPMRERTTLTVRVTWARSLPPTDPLPQDVTLRQEHFHILEQLAERLRPIGPERPAQFIGYVDTLRGVPGPDGRPAGEAWVTILDGGELLPVRMELDATAYAVAGQAHLENQPVRLVGVLRRTAGINQVQEVSEFDRLEPPVARVA
jgi:hypothetical protein